MELKLPSSLKYCSFYFNPAIATSNMAKNQVTFSRYLVAIKAPLAIGRNRERRIVGPEAPAPDINIDIVRALLTSVYV